MIEATSDPKFVGGNYFDKYRSNNPIHRWLMRGFLNSVRELLDSIQFESVLEVGCGPGDLANEVIPKNLPYLGLDIDRREIEKAHNRYPNLQFDVANAMDLPVASKSFDLAIMCEVLEHLEDPRQAMAEIDRVSKKAVLLSVPREPLWRILNFARGKYCSQLGNTPGHVQHFSKRSFYKLCSERFEVVHVRYPIPWLMALARPLRDRLP